MDLLHSMLQPLNTANEGAFSAHFSHVLALTTGRAGLVCRAAVSVKAGRWLA
jgi:hypothetical protein